jgi:hypothetical protein
MRIIQGFLAATALAACAGTRKESARPAPLRHEVSQDVDGAACAEPAPTRMVAVAKPLTADDLAQIGRAVGESSSSPIIRIEERPDSAIEGSPGADRVLIVVLYGGYDRCLHFGTNSGSTVERLRGRWQVLGMAGRLKEYVH